MNAKDFAEIVIAALLCATGGAVMVQALLAIERRRAMLSVDLPVCASAGGSGARTRVSITVQIVDDLLGWTNAQRRFNAAAERYEEQHR